MKAPKAGIRVDGGKRVDLVELRRRRAANSEVRKSAPPVEDKRVSDAWARADNREAAAQRLDKEAKRIAKAVKKDGLKDGAIVSSVRIRISGTRSEVQAIRARPGSFEWAYGRNKQDSLFHAGSHFARLWEKAGATVASSANFLRGTASGYGTGLSEGRVQALDALDGVRNRLGHFTLERLIDYCVAGLTSREIATKHQSDERAMKHVLQEDLKACATHFGFLRQGKK